MRIIINDYGQYVRHEYSGGSISVDLNRHGFNLPGAPLQFGIDADIFHSGPRFLLVRVL